MKAYQTITLKQIIVLLVVIIVSYGCGRSQEEITHPQLQLRNGVWYKIDTETPYTGRVVSKHPNGQKQFEWTFKDGKKEGTGTWWHENGQKLSEVAYKDGKQEGTFTAWHENGQKQNECTYKEGKREGPYTWWHENGRRNRRGPSKMANKKA